MKTEIPATIGRHEPVATQTLVVFCIRTPRLFFRGRPVEIIRFVFYRFMARR